MPHTPIRRKLMRMVLLTSGLVILFTCAMFVTYEVVTFKQTVARQLDILGKAIAQNSTAALAFDNADDARAVLSAFRADPHIVSAALYGKSGALFASYPDGVASEDLPRRVAAGRLSLRGPARHRLRAGAPERRGARHVVREIGPSGHRSALQRLHAHHRAGDRAGRAAGVLRRQQTAIGDLAAAARPRRHRARGVGQTRLQRARAIRRARRRSRCSPTRSITCSRRSSIPRRARTRRCSASRCCSTSRPRSATGRTCRASSRWCCATWKKTCRSISAACACTTRRPPRSP